MTMFETVSREIRVEAGNRILAEFCRRQPSQFLTVRLRGRFPWPREFTQLRLFERDWLLWPNTEWDRPAIIIHCPKGDGTDEAALFKRFLSAFTWSYGVAIEDEGFWITGTGPNGCWRDESELNDLHKLNRGLLIDCNDYLPLPENRQAQVALALYREGICLDNTSYKFLSFFKILNVKFNVTQQQIDWINRELQNITEREARSRIVKIQSAHADVGKYLYQSGRCAVSHAYDNKIVNPDNPEDGRRLSMDLPVIKALAERVIETELNIKSARTVFQEHLYELHGFKELLGSRLLKDVIAGNHVSRKRIPIITEIQNALPTISVRLRGETVRPFEDLNPEVINYEEGRIILRCSSNDHLQEVYLGLNFRTERLEYSPYDDFITYDDGSARAAFLAAESYKFCALIIANGRLDVWSRSKLLGRVDAFIGKNIDLGRTLDLHRDRERRFRTMAGLRTVTLPNEVASFDAGKLHLTTALSSAKKLPDFRFSM